MSRLSPESPGREYLDKIRQAAQRAAELTNQILAYSGKGQFVVEPIELNRLVAEMVHLLETAISKKAALRVEPGIELSAIEADASQVRQVVMNLITNASEALGDAPGTIRVRTRMIEVDGEYLEQCYPNPDLAPGRYVCLEVHDTGAGMDEATRRKIFDPFFTTKFTGRGLGLAAVLGITRGHRGAIRVDSQAGRGTTVTVLFPPSDMRLAHTAVEPIRPLWSADGATILVVDDDETVREVSRAMLEEAGFRVLTSADGLQAVDTLRRHGEEIALALLDLTMPRLDGEEALRRMREIRPDLRVVLSSGYSEQDAVGRFGDVELLGFVQKPYSCSTLLEVVRRALGPDE
jgi:CheY-like chemotaxis protein